MRTINTSIFAALFVAFVLTLAGGYVISTMAGESANQAGPIMRPDTTHPKTCKGLPSTSSAKVYSFGFNSPDGTCTTREFIANGYNEAMECAQAFCPTCSIEDQTSIYEAAPYTFRNSLVNEYCPIK